MATEAAKPANNSEDLFQDKTTRAARDKALDHMKWGPLIGSVARFMMAIGGFVAISDRRYRAVRRTASDDNKVVASA